MYTASIRWAPAHELINSLGVYLDKKSLKLTDLGPAWAAEVRAQLDCGFAEQLAEGVAVDGGLLHLLVELQGGEPDAPAFLTWLAAASPGELYELLAPYRRDDATRWPTDLLAFRDLSVEILSEWNRQYFAGTDPAIRGSLAAEAATRRAGAAGLSPMELVEQATNGIVLEPAAGLEQIVLVPVYHQRPINQFMLFRSLGFYLYGYDDPPAPGEISASTLRLLRALTDESRGRILRFVSRESRSFMEITRHTGLALSTVHHHLIALRAAGLLRVHEPTPGSGGGTGEKNTARYSLRTAGLEGLGERLIAALTGGDPV